MKYSHIYSKTSDGDNNYFLFEDGTIQNVSYFSGGGYYLTGKYKPIIENVNPENKFIFSFKKPLPFDMRLDFSEDDLKSKFIKCYYPDLDLIILNKMKPGSKTYKVAYMYQYTDQGIFIVTVYKKEAAINFIALSTSEDNNFNIAEFKTIVSSKIEFIDDIREGIFIPKQMEIKNKISVSYDLISIEDLTAERNYKYILGYKVVNICNDKDKDSFIPNIGTNIVANCCIYIENHKFVFNYDSKLTVVASENDINKIPLRYEMKPLTHIKSLREIEEDLRNEK